MLINIFKHRLFYKIATPILLILACLHWLVPAIVVVSLERWYAKQGENNELIIGGWNFSPWQGAIQLNDVEFHYPDRTFTVSYLSVNIGLLRLFDRVISIQNFEVDDATIEVSDSSDTITVLGIPFKKGNKDEVVSQQLADNSEENEARDESSLWHVEIKNIHIENQVVAFMHEGVQLEMNIAQLNIDNANDSEWLSIHSDIHLKSLLTLTPKVVLTSPLNIKLSGAIKAPFTQPIFQGDISVLDASVDTPWLPTTGFKALTLQGLNLSLEKQVMQKAILRGLFIDQELLKLDQYEVDGLSYIDNQLVTGDHIWQGLKVQLQLNEAGGISQLSINEGASNQLNQAEAGEQNSSEAMTAEEKALSKFTWKVASVKQAEEDESHLVVINTWLKPKVNLPITLTDIEIDNLTNMKGIIHGYLKAAMDEYNSITLSTNIENDMNNGTIDFNVSQFDLVALNGFINKAIGYQLEKGQLNVNSNIKIVQGNISGNSKVFLRNSYFVPSNQQTMDKISKQISMPIETVLSLIKDDNNNIKIDIPMKGNIHAPDFGLDDLITKITKTALQAATIQYVKMALFPYGLMVSVADFIGDQVFSISLTSMEVTSSDLSEEQQDYLQKISKMMTQKQELQLHVCSVVSQEDAKRGDWHEDALVRAKAIKRYLVDTNELLAPRILICQPAIKEKTQVLMGF